MINGSTIKRHMSNPSLDGKGTRKQTKISAAKSEECSPPSTNRSYGSADGLEETPDVDETDTVESRGSTFQCCTLTLSDNEDDGNHINQRPNRLERTTSTPVLRDSNCTTADKPGTIIGVNVIGSSNTNVSGTCTSTANGSIEGGDSKNVLNVIPINGDIRSAEEVKDHNETFVVKTIRGQPISSLEQAGGEEENLTSPSHDDLSTNTESSSSTSAGEHIEGSGNWGWFEDVHNDTPGKGEKSRDGDEEEGGNNLNTDLETKTEGTLNTKNGDLIETGENAKQGEEHGPLHTFGRGSKTKKKTKKGGLLQFSNSTVMPLNDIVSKDRDTSSMAVTAPNYVLEESISSQKLWKATAGHRPPQPVEERAFFEKLWAQNFLRSEVKYYMPVDVLTASSPVSLSPFADGDLADSAGAAGISSYNIAGQFNANLFGGGSGDRTRSKAAEADVAEATILHRTKTAASKEKGGFLSPEMRKVRKDPPKKIDGSLSVLIRGDNVFGTTVSKSFARPDQPGRIDTISISLASYRVVQSKKHGKYAQYLVVYREGSFQDTVGVWKRYSDFDALARTVTSGEESCSNLLSAMHPLAVDEDHDKELLPNAITSWRLLKKRQRWFRCLDSGYLSLKVFLLERFLHDILFECTDPKILRDFIGVDFMH